MSGGDVGAVGDRAGAPGSAGSAGSKGGRSTSTVVPATARRRRGPRAWWRRRRRTTKIILLSLVGFGFVLFVGLCAIVYTAVRIPLPASVAEPEQIQLTYADGSQLGTIGQVDRVEVPISAVPLVVQHDVLAAEDRNFYHESGFSVRGIGRALLADVTAGKISQGGSTITQQYAKNAYLTQQRTFTRKIKELVISVKLAHKYSKDQILDDYLNTIYFGRGAYGIQAASEAYFGTSVIHLDAAQGAVLAGLIREPSYLDPAVAPAAAKQRWSEVIATMVSQKWLTAAQAATLTFPPTVAPSTAAARAGTTGPTSFIADQANAFLDAKLGSATVALGGLTVTTTIDRADQADAVAAVAGENAPAAVRTGLVSVNPQTGAIEAYYGGTSDSQADAVSYLTAPPGSSFKPIVLAEALSQGTTLTKTYSGDSPQTLGGTVVHNFDDEQFGNINLVTATAQSVNTVYVHLNLDIGPASVVSLAHTLGLRTDPKNPLDPVGTLALGEDYVYPIDMAGVYSSFANGGLKVTPYIVSKVVNRAGKTIYSANTATTRVLPTSVTSNVTYAMQHVLTDGTAAGDGLSGRESAGKTGTTSGDIPNIAAWFDGYTPQLVTVVAMSAPVNGKPATIEPWPTCGCSEVTGGTAPAHLWHVYMTAALAGQPVLTFPTPTAAVPTTSSSASASVSPSATATTPTATATTSAPPTPTPTASVTVTVPVTPTSASATPTVTTTTLSPTPTSTVTTTPTTAPIVGASPHATTTPGAAARPGSDARAGPGP